MKQEYTGNNNITRHLNPPYLVSNFDELNILADLMENRLGLTYTTELINCHSYRNSFDAVCRSTVNISLLGLQPKITRIQKIQQRVRRIRVSGKKNNNAQTKQWLITLNSTSRGLRVSTYQNGKKCNAETKISTRIIPPSPYCSINTKGER